MSPRYRISPEGGREPLTEQDILRHKDPKRLLYNYHRAARALHRRPLYRDPKAFIALVLIVLLAIFIAEVVEKEHLPPPEEQPTAPPAGH